METARERATGGRGLIAVMLVAPIAWVVMHMFDYVWVETACRAGILTETWLGLPGLAWVVVAATLLALIASIVSGVLSFRHWRAVREPVDMDDVDPVETRSRFLARSGFMISVLFALLIVLTGVPLIFVSPCVAMP